MSSFATTLRRFSRSSSRSKEPKSPTASHSHAASTGAASIRSSGTGGADHPHISNPIPQLPTVGSTGPSSMHQNGAVNDGRPISSGTDGSFDFANRPVTQHLPHQYRQPALPSTTAATMMPMSPAGAYAPAHPTATSAGGLSRTDKIVLKHFWDTKYQENIKRDLHYLKFPFFPQFPAYSDLLPYCEIYHLIKTSPGANIISLGSTNGVYIGFELQAGSQLHIDMDDEWHNISHHRVHFRPLENMLRDPNAESQFKRWPKPLTIEFLEEEYQSWILDLMSLCWEGREVRELGGPTSSGPGGGVGGVGEPTGKPTTSGTNNPSSTMSGGGGGGGLGFANAPTASTVTGPGANGASNTGATGSTGEARKRF